jgi:type IV fimbrial biogenesis protein FimT
MRGMTSNRRTSSARSSTRALPHRVSGFVGRPIGPQRGFTLTELLVTMGIAAILAAVALPNFGPTLQGSRSWSDTNTLHASINRARSEAARLGTAVTICASNDAATCAGTNWASGWLVFADPDRSHTVNTGDTMIEKQGAVSATVTNSVSGTYAVTIEPSGRVSYGMTAGGTFTVARTGASSRVICLNVAGRTRVLQGGESTC